MCYSKWALLDGGTHQKIKKNNFGKRTWCRSLCFKTPKNFALVLARQDGLVVEKATHMNMAMQTFQSVRMSFSSQNLLKKQTYTNRINSVHEPWECVCHSEDANDDTSRGSTDSFDRPPSPGLCPVTFLFSIHVSLSPLCDVCRLSLMSVDVCNHYTTEAAGKQDRSY